MLGLYAQGELSSGRTPQLLGMLRDEFISSRVYSGDISNDVGRVKFGVRVRETHVPIRPPELALISHERAEAAVAGCR